MISGRRFSASRSRETYPNRITAVTDMNTVTGRRIATRVICKGALLMRLRRDAAFVFAA